jgi:hypothetical protein
MADDRKGKSDPWWAALMGAAVLFGVAALARQKKTRAEGAGGDSLAPGRVRPDAS